MNPRLAIAEFPELQALTPDELRAYFVAFHNRRAVSNFALSFGSLILGSLTFIFSGLFVVMVLNVIWGSSQGLDRDAVITASSLLTAVLATIWVVRRYRRRHEISALFLQLRHDTICAGCKYDLRGAPAFADRSEVTRCPECGLVNPLPQSR